MERALLPAAFDFASDFDLKFPRGMLRANFLQVARVKVIDEAKYHAIGT